MQTKSIKVIVWSQTNCQYCSMAKALLSNLGFNNVEERIVGMDEGNWRKEDLVKAVPDVRSVPQIFIGDKHIGGFAQLKEYLAYDNITKA